MSNSCNSCHFCKIWGNWINNTIAAERERWNLREIGFSWLSGNALAFPLNILQVKSEAPLKKNLGLLAVWKLQLPKIHPNQKTQSRHLTSLSIKSDIFWPALTNYVLFISSEWTRFFRIESPVWRWINAKTATIVLWVSILVNYVWLFFIVFDPASAFDYQRWWINC